MTMQHTIDIRSTNLPSRESLVARIVGDAQVDVRVSSVRAYFNVHIPPVFSVQTVRPLFARLAEVLPMRMSETHVAQLRMRFPQPAATDDPATYEFETQ